MSDLISIQNISKSFGDHKAVDELSLTVPEGMIYGFIGPNGSGKTTTIRMIMNIIYPDAGTIKIFGEEYQPSFQNRIGYLPEERGLYKNMKVLDLLLFFGKLKSGKNVKKEALKWLKKLELFDWADKKVESLSKGMSQKIQFISAVISNPELVILDEPFSGLDPVNRDVLRNAVLDLKREGKTIIFSTHDMTVAEKMCDHLFMIYKGRKVLNGTLEETQDLYGRDIIKIITDKGSEVLRFLPGIEKVTDFGRIQELRMAKGCDPQEVLKELIKIARVEHFEIAKPSLHDIFVRIASPEEENSAKEVEYV